LKSAVNAFGSPEMLEDPFPFFETVRHTEPVCRVPERNVYLVTRREDLEFAFLHPEIFSNSGRTPGRTYPGQRYKTIPDLASTDPPEHRARRVMYLDLIGPRRMAQLRPTMERKAHSLIDGFGDEAEVELIASYAKLLPAWVMGWVLGVPEELHEQLDRWAGEYFELFDSSLHRKGEFDDVEKRLIPSFVDFTNFCGDLVVDWRENGEEGSPLRSFAFSRKEDGTRFSVDELANEVRLLVVGAQTTANLIAQAVVDVLELDVRGDLSEEKHVQLIVDESLRKDGPATYIPRICAQEVDLSGVVIPAGARVFLAIQSGNRDETYYECPARFDVERSNLKKHLAFGFGTHHCVGAPIARMEATVALMALFGRYPRLQLSPRNDYAHRTDLTALRALREVYVELGTP
jgi:cytochrome P450